MIKNDFDLNGRHTDLDYLNAISVSDCSGDEWLCVGEYLHDRCYPVTVWVAWSKGKPDRPDPRYNEGECEELWDEMPDQNKDLWGYDYIKSLYYWKSGLATICNELRGDPDIVTQDFGIEDISEYISDRINRLMPDTHDVDLPEHCYTLAAFEKNPREPAEELIESVLRKGHKMLVSGPSKAGKTFLLMELVIAIVEGITWLGFRCAKGRALYLNLEVDEASANRRFLEIYDALGIPRAHMDDIITWNLRGRAKPLDQLSYEIIHLAIATKVSVIVIDPIYKILTGDENNATDMAKFCNFFDMIAEATGCSIIYCHHHSKGAQGSRRSADRASGSGVFARDPDAVLDMSPLTDAEENDDFKGATAWRIESNLREFKDFKPVNCWYKYPLHIIDSSGMLEKAHIEGSSGANLAKSPKRTTEAERSTTLVKAYNICSTSMAVVRVKDIAKQAGITERSVREYISENPDFMNDHGVVTYRKRTSDF